MQVPKFIANSGRSQLKLLLILVQDRDPQRDQSYMYVLYLALVRHPQSKLLTV